MRNPDAVAAAVAGMDLVFHLAGLLHAAASDRVPPERYDSINVGGTRVVADAARRAGVRRLVLFSTISVYGPGAGATLTEDSTPRPDSLYGASKLEAERVALAAQGSDGAALGTVLRLGAVYGPRVKGNYRRLLDVLARRRFVSIGDGTIAARSSTTRMRRPPQ